MVDITILWLWLGGVVRAVPLLDLAVVEGSNSLSLNFSSSFAVKDATLLSYTSSLDSYYTHE